MGNKMSSEELHIVDQYELEKNNDQRTIYTTFGPKVIMGFISFLCILADVLKYIQFKPFWGILKHADWIFMNVPVVIFVLMLIFYRSAKCDTWIISMARSNLGSTFTKVTTRKIILNFDVRYTAKDINKFVQDLTDRSELYNYFLVKTDYTNSRIHIKTRKRVHIPEKTSFTKEYEQDEKWNYIPLGITLTKKSELGSVNWMLNDQEKVGVPTRETIPSVSFLVAGTTGSGKSVVETNIIRHINKFHDRTQGILVDVKRVEFGNLSNLEGINVVATDVEQACFSLESIKNIMYDRFKFMECEDCNNIYKIKNYKCAYFVFDCNGKQIKMQFDEILYCRIDGKVVINTVDNIYDRIKKEEEVFIYFEGQKAPPVIFNPQDDYYFIAGDIYGPDDIVKTKREKIPAVELIKRINAGEVIDF